MMGPIDLCCSGKVILLSQHRSSCVKIPDFSRHRHDHSVAFSFSCLQNPSADQRTRRIDLDGVPARGANRAVVARQGHDFTDASRADQRRPPRP